MRSSYQLYAGVYLKCMILWLYYEDESMLWASGRYIMDFGLRSAEKGGGHARPLSSWGGEAQRSIGGSRP